MDGAYGYNLPGKMGPTLGSLYVNHLIERCARLHYPIIFLSSKWLLL